MGLEALTFDHIEHGKTGLLVEPGDTQALANAAGLGRSAIAEDRSALEAYGRSVGRQIVDGAVGMVQMALSELDEQGVVDLDEERKASMVSNLLVVLCGEENARPVVNTGSLYS